MSAARILLAACLVLLAACARAPGPEPVKAPGTSTVYELKLSDGTPCAVYSNSVYQNGGISCGWRQ